MQGLVTPEVWKTGSREQQLGRKAGNTLLSQKRELNRHNPYSSTCKICKKKTPTGHHYCQECSYKKGICSMCGRKILDVSCYLQSTV